MSSTVRRHESEEHSFELVTGVPDARLRGLVRGYQDFWERSAGPIGRREVASPDTVVIVDLGRGWRIGEGGGAARLGSFTGGLSDGPEVVEHDGEARAVQIDLTPLGARALFGVPLGELARTVVPLDDVLGREAALLAERLDGAQGSRERFAILDQLLLDRITRAQPGRPDVAWAWRRLVESDGRVPVAALAEELGCSRRHLTRRFSEEIGLPPKTFARILRFRRATELLVEGGEAKLGEVAAWCGYADQAHFNRDFRAFAGVSPTALLASRLPGGAGMAA